MLVFPGGILDKFIKNFNKKLLLTIAEVIFHIFEYAGVDGGFDNNEPEYEESYSIVILPDFVSLPFPSVELPEKVAFVIR